MKQKTIFTLVVFLFSQANIVPADDYYNKATYGIYNQTWNIGTWDDRSKSIYFRLTLDTYENQSLLITDWNYFFDSTNSVMNGIGDADYLDGCEDLICKPTNMMFDKTDFNFQGDIIIGTIPDEETLSIAPVLVVIFGSLGIALFVWMLKRKRMI